MSPLRSNPFKSLVIITVCLVLAGCASSGPKQPQPGTPEFQWQVARNAYSTGDYAKTIDFLTRLSETSNPYTAQAQPWALVMSLGTANAYMDLVDKYTEGSKRNRTNPGPLRKVAAEYKTKAAASAMQFVELCHRFTESNKGADVVFAFDLPVGSLDDPVEYKKILAGQIIQESEQFAVERAVVKREMLRNALRAMNIPKDIEKAKAAYQAGEAKVPGKSFMFMTAKGLYDISEMFGPKKLDQPQRMKTIYAEALEALEIVKDNKEAKDLIKKITDSQKKYKFTS